MLSCKATLWLALVANLLIQLGCIAFIMQVVTKCSVRQLVQLLYIDLILNSTLHDDSDNNKALFES